MRGETIFSKDFGFSDCMIPLIPPGKLNKVQKYLEKVEIWNPSGF